MPQLCRCQFPMPVVMASYRINKGTFTMQVLHQVLHRPPLTRPITHLWSTLGPWMLSETVRTLGGPCVTEIFLSSCNKVFIIIIPVWEIIKTLLIHLTSGQSTPKSSQNKGDIWLTRCFFSLQWDIGYKLGFPAQPACFYKLFRCSKPYHEIGSPEIVPIIGCRKRKG